MISMPEIEAWRQTSPLALAAHMAERDMLLRRLLIEVGNDDVLSQVVVCAGGTTLHQVLLPQPGRYSEDLDLWLAAEVNAYKPICDRWHEAAALDFAQRAKSRRCSRSRASASSGGALARR